MMLRMISLLKVHWHGYSCVTSSNLLFPQDKVISFLLQDPIIMFIPNINLNCKFMFDITLVLSTRKTKLNKWFPFSECWEKILCLSNKSEATHTISCLWYPKYRFDIDIVIIDNQFDSMSDLLNEPVSAYLCRIRMKSTCRYYTE